MEANSYDEWSALKEVIVGSPENYSIHDFDLSFKIFFHDVAYQSYFENDPPRNINKKYIEELSEDVEGFVNVLKGLGVVVHRPIPLKAQDKITSPYWTTIPTPALNIRDQAIILGNEIIETPPQQRARYFENDLLKPIFYKYFRDGSKWNVMPRPVLTDRSFDLSYIRDQSPVGFDKTYSQSNSSFDVGFEMMIDGAQFVKFGKDILVNVANANHELGLIWFQHHFGDKFKFHKVYRMTDNHIDSIILPLRPGMLLMRSPKYRDLLPEKFKKWDVIYLPIADDQNFPKYQEQDLILTSKYIDLNVFSVDQDKVIVNSQFPQLIKLLEKNHFTVFPVQHRHRRIFAGGFHCFTLDIVRSGTLENYF